MRLVVIVSLLVGCRFEHGTVLPPDDSSHDSSSTNPHDAPTHDVPSDVPSVALRYNLGGSPHVGVDFPGTWTADPSACTNAASWYESASLPNSNDDPLFQRYIYGDATCGFGTNLPHASYRVRLLFAEVYVGPGCPVSGSRNFNVSLEGNVVISNLDVYAEGGGCAHTTGTPVARAFTMNITDGTLDVELSANSGIAMLSAIEIVTP